MRRVAVLGGGPAGALAARQLASAGIDTLVFDEKLAWEKPCGGALTARAYCEYPFLLDNSTPKRLVVDVRLEGPRVKPAHLTLRKPILLYSRRELNQLLLDRAAQAGARLERTRVLGATRSNGGWVVQTREGTVEADFCIVATGARNPLREMGVRFRADDAMTALGYMIQFARRSASVRAVVDDLFAGYQPCLDLKKRWLDCWKGGPLDVIRGFGLARAIPSQKPL